MAKKQEKQVVEAKSDTQKIKALQERIEELERIFGQRQLLLEYKDKMIEIAESTYGVDIKKESVPGSRLVLLQPERTPKKVEFILFLKT
jgi:hypothetical protein